MVTWTDESAYVHLGYLTVTGQINLFQDELTGSRMPLSFWIVGGSQVLWGRSLLAARLAGLGLGLARRRCAPASSRSRRDDSDGGAGGGAVVGEAVEEADLVLAEGGGQGDGPGLGGGAGQGVEEGILGI
jgi:hypothetical protein